ncbi:M28 family peptidase [bacterium]|nr:M28 family peptidase [bacterium]
MSNFLPLFKQLNPAAIQQDLFYLSENPLPCRALNYTIPGHEKSTLDEADEFIIQRMKTLNCSVTTEIVPIQAFQPDPSVPHGFRKPLPNEPWYDGVNILAAKVGVTRPDEKIVLIAHKDTQSWLFPGPGAHDNAVGTATNLELARILFSHKTHRTIIFLFCNEEHWPWTSGDAARNLAKAPGRVIAALNTDSIGGKAAATSALKNITRFVTPEGERIADLFNQLNTHYNFGLEQSKYKSPAPNDDDGEFVIAGIPGAVLNIGSMPYADPNYHTCSDVPEYVDMENVAAVARLILAGILHLDRDGFPE